MSYIGPNKTNTGNVPPVSWPYKHRSVPWAPCGTYSQSIPCLPGRYYHKEIHQRGTAACRILRNVIVSIFYLFAAYRQFVILISRRARYCISFRFLSPFPVSRRSCPYPRTPLRQSCIRVLPENLRQSPGCSW